jgi:hypothetical protein
MDPKTLSGLDPKLRETYERVMGAAAASNGTAPSQASNPAANPKPSPSPNTSAQESNESTAQIPIPPPDTSAPKTTPVLDASMITNPSVQPAELAALQPTMTGAAMPASQNNSSQPEKPLQPLPSPASINQTAAKTGLSPLLRILYITAGIIFFIVYAIFWLKLFNFPLPF